MDEESDSFACHIFYNLRGLVFHMHTVQIKAETIPVLKNAYLYTSYP